MIPTSFDYAAPETLAEAVGLLSQHGEDAKILTGGHSLIPLLRLRLARPEIVVDLRKIDRLSGIREVGGGLELGAATTHAEIEGSDVVARVLPLLAETAASIGDVQVRNAGTIGGSVVHADPAADWPAALLALDAAMVLHGPSGERTVPATGFFTGLLESATRPDEILVAIRVPAAETASGGAYEKLPQSASGFALAGAAAQVTLGDGTIASARLGITGVADCPYRAESAEAALSGTPATEEAVEAACATVAEGVTALEDIHASAGYRTHLARVLARRAVLAAVERAGNGA